MLFLYQQTEIPWLSYEKGSIVSISLWKIDSDILCVNICNIYYILLCINLCLVPTNYYIFCKLREMTAYGFKSHQMTHLQ